MLIEGALLMMDKFMAELKNADPEQKEKFMKHTLDFAEEFIVAMKKNY